MAADAEKLEVSGGCTIVRPPVRGVTAAQSTRAGIVGGLPSEMNLSYRIGDLRERVDGNRRAFFAAAGVPDPRLVSPSQVHGDAISVVDAPGSPANCDATITATPGLTLAVTIADCLPILLFDPAARALGVVHAGWRGSRKGIAAGAVKLMAERYGARPDRMLAHIGPSAGVCCYEVGPEVGDLFPGFVEHRGGRRFLNLWKYTLNSLQNAGIPAAQTSSTTYCTICNAGLFHSYRRDGERSGRMMFVAVFH